MAVQLGIDLSPARCRIIELDGREGGVASFASVAADDPAARATLASLRGRRAAVVVWGARSDHRQVVVTRGSYDRMRSEARARLHDAGLPGFSLRGTLSDIAPAGGDDRQVVMLASASGAEVAAALAPLLDAGVTIYSVLTPAAALQALARMQRRPAVPGLEAYVALTETATCIAVVHDGALVAARDLRWGYLDESSEFETRLREDIARRLAEEISSCIAACRVSGAPPLAQVYVCGGLHDLRGMTMALMERIDVEVEALDSLSGIDQANLPEPAGEFRERIAGMRLAWAAAVVHRPALDLYRDRRRRVVRMHLSRAVMTAGAAAGLGIGWWVQGQWRPVERRPMRVARAAVAAPLVAAPARVERTRAEPRVPNVSSPAATAFRMPVPAPPPLSAMSIPAAVVEPVRTSSARPVAAPLRAPAIPSISSNSALTSTSSITGDVGTILYGADRQLAIVDGRIIQVGDEVSGARVVEITSGAVVLRDAQGRVTRLAVGAPGSM